MTPILAITAEHNDARLLSSRDYADSGTGPSYIELFDTARVQVTDPPGSTPVVRLVLSKPCGVLVDHKLVLDQADNTGDLIARDSAAGGVLWGRWYRSDGKVVGDADASDAAGDGFFKVAGSVGTLMYAGGRALLGSVAID